MKSHELGITPMVTKICAAIALVSLVGCGGADGNGSSSSSAALSSAAPSSAAPSSIATSSAAPSSTALSSVSSSEALSSLALSSVAESSSSIAQSSDSIVVTPSSAAESSSSAPSSIAESSSSSAALSSVASSSSSEAPQWELVWSDEFNGTEIDTSKWGFEKNCWGGGNNEQQCYTDRPVNSYVADGVLTIVAQRETFTGPNTPEGDGPGTATLPYTSARLRTKNIQEWTFGRFEIRAKLPAGQGTWPAIWMLPTNSPYGVWASSGEIDIMEAVNLKTVTGNAAPEARVYGTLHYGRTWPGNKSSGAEYTLPGGINPADDFHTYALEWEEGEIRWYVDGVHFATQRDTGWYGQYMQDGKLVDAPVGAPFDRHSQFHLLLNLAVGGSWAGNTNNTGIYATVFPQKMLVDFVRVYQCSGSPVDGKGCATIDENAEIVPGNTRPIIGTVEFPGPPLFVMYGDDLTTGLKFNSYDTEKVISYSEIAEAGRGDVLHVVKTGNNGNVYFEVNGDPTDLTNWSDDSELIFDVKVNSKAAGANLLVKIDSGWPNVSDFTVPVAANGVWKEIRITLADLVDNRNSMNGGNGIANLASIKNTFVIDSTGAIDVSFDNVRIEGEERDETVVFAPLPLFNIYENSVGSGLQVQTYTDGGAQVVTSEVADDVDHGQVFKLVKTGAIGNVFFNIPGKANLSHWSANGKLKFDYKVISKDIGTTLLVKMDSEWPNVSDVNVPLGADGVWSSFSIDISDLIDNPNSNPCCGGIVNINSISNIFVIEPSGPVEIMFDNIRFEAEPEQFAPLPLFTVWDSALADDVDLLSYNPNGHITLSMDNDAGYGQVVKLVKNGSNGNIFFNAKNGPVDLSHWSGTGELVFNFKVNSRGAGTNLLVKMDSGWPNVSDVVVPLPADGVWTEFRIGIADLIDNGNSVSCCPGVAAVNAISNVFVLEPTGDIDMVFDEVRLEEK